MDYEEEEESESESDSESDEGYRPRSRTKRAQALAAANAAKAAAAKRRPQSQPQQSSHGPMRMGGTHSPADVEYSNGVRKLQASCYALLHTTNTCELLGQSNRSLSVSLGGKSMSRA